MPLLLHRVMHSFKSTLTVKELAGLWGSWCFSLANSTKEHEAEGNSQKEYKAKRQSVRSLEAIHQEWWIKGERMLHAAQPLNHMKPSTQLLAHSKDNTFGWMFFLGFCESLQSQPLSLIMWANSMMYLPSLYFWLLSKACSYGEQREKSPKNSEH